MDNIKSAKKNKINRKLFFAEIVSVFFWLYLVVKLFVFDFDYYLIYNYAPSFLWILDLKFFFLLAIVAILVTLLKPKSFFKLIGFVAIYPLFIAFWRIPKILFKSKSWMGMFALIEALFSFFKSFKLNIIVFTLVILSCFIILKISSIHALIFSMLILFVCLIIHYVRRFKYAINSTNFIPIYEKKVDVTQNKLQNKHSVKNISKYDGKNEINSAWVDRLKKELIVNKVFYFLIAKLRNFQKSSFSLIYSLLKLSYTFLFTVLLFAFQNLALFRINPDSFGGSLPKNFGTFFYYSFNSIVGNNINDFYPLSGYARVLNSVAVLFGIIIFIIVFFILTTIYGKKHNEKIDTAVDLCKNQAQSIEQFLQQEYKLNIEEAMQEVKKAEDAIVKVIYFLVANS